MTTSSARKAVRWTIEQTRGEHNSFEFYCGVRELDDYIKSYKTKSDKPITDDFEAFVATAPAFPNKVIGYYTLKPFHIFSDQMPRGSTTGSATKFLEFRLLGHLAVTEPDQGRGLGTMLLANAIKRIRKISDRKVHGIVTDALDRTDDRGREAKGFYQQYGFLPLKTKKNRLILPIKPFETAE